MAESTVSKSEQVHTGNRGSIEVGSSMPAVFEPDDKVKKVIVAVHGIGDQFNFATIQSVVSRFCVYYKQPAAVPLGNFHGGRPGYSLALPYPPDPFEQLAFAEVYWAPIAREAAQEKHTLEEAKAWAHTIVERLRLRWYEEKKARERQGKAVAPCRDEDFQLAQQVLSEMIQTIAVVDRLCFLADKAGLFTFDLKKLLDDYLGDVQIVAEFADFRERILNKFSELLENVQKAFPEADIYLVAHSEGTVVALLGLLQAFRKADPPLWTRKLRGVMTMGSPIDKHLALWPELFGEGAPSAAAVKGLGNEKIEWRNYYDFGDPVGFDLGGIREWIAVQGWQDVFSFEDGKHDYGFTRYPLPGKAHVDYWKDGAVFDHFISTVVEKDRPDKKKEEPPGSLSGNRLISYVVPYVGIFALLFISAYVLYKTVSEAITAPAILQAQDPNVVFLRSAGLAALLFGITVVARIPRLTYQPLWRAISLAVAGLGASFYLWSVHDAVGTKIGGQPIPPGGITLGLGILVALLAFVVSVKRPSWGLTPLMVTGAIAVTVMVAHYVQKTTGPVWPVVLATAGSLYLWWLSALLFDLIFAWHLYIRNARVLDRINRILGTYKERAPLGSLTSAAPAAS